MTVVDRIQRSARRLAAVALAAAAVSACATAPRSQPVGTASTTGAYMPGAVELYVARQDQAPAGACPRDLPPNVEFPQRSAELVPAEAAYVDRWAACLNAPAMQHATVVLVGGDDPALGERLFVRRAERIRSALVARGVDGRRIVIGASNATREGGPYASTSGVRLEVTHQSSLRSYPAQNPAVRYGLH